MSDFLLGRYLKFDIEALRAYRGGAPFRELLEAEQISEQQIQSLETGVWRSVDHRALFVLMCAAEAWGVFPLLQSIDSRFWETFLLPNVNGLALVGIDLDGGNVDDDIAAASKLLKAGLPLEIVSVRESHNEDLLCDWVRSRNLVVVGGSKVNRATHVALQELWRTEGGPPVRFLWPDFQRDDETCGPSPNKRRALEVRENGQTILIEQDSDDRHLGLVAIGRMSPETTTVIVAGCSSQATKRIVAELLRPSLYNHYSADWLKDRLEHPTMFLFDSGSPKSYWRVVGMKPPKRKAGRKPGQRPRRFM